ncbi:MAG: NAD(P)H-dependent glycerol-3-phosphate dehydrogenase [Pseudomonadota bacterium]
MSLSVLGAGAFGTSLAIALARNGHDVVLWGRGEAQMQTMQTTRDTGHRLPGHQLPESVLATCDLRDTDSDALLLCVPMQGLADFAGQLECRAKTLVACCKGVDRQTGLGPVATLRARQPSCQAAMLTGPSFAQDIAVGLPTALVLACEDEACAQKLQDALSRPALRIYRSTDVVGAELGGALKNVIALAAGVTIGAGLGDSARASVIARGFAEIARYATSKGAALETLQGLSGLGDLVLTCTSDKSRNFAAGVALGQGVKPMEETIEGMATAQAVAADATKLGLDLPLVQTVSKVVSGSLDIPSAVATLMARPVGKE